MSTRKLMVDKIGMVNIAKNRQSTRFKISVQPTGNVRVTIPWIASFQSGEKFLMEQMPWILATKEKFATLQKPSAKIQEGLLFVTRNYHYEIIKAPVSGIKIKYVQNENKIYFQIPEEQSNEDENFKSKLRLAVENVLLFDSKGYLPARLAELAKTLGYTFKKVTIKNNKTNWGSCSGKKNINLNLHLMRLEDRLIDFILVHELVHTVIPNHGPDFKARMLSHFPDMAELDKKIKKFKTNIF